MKRVYNFQPESASAALRVPSGQPDHDSHYLGLDQGEPLIVAMDGLLRYAKAYQTRIGGKLANDAVLGVYWLEAIKGLHGLLNGDGAVAMELDRTTDSKSNGAVESVYQAALKVAGFNEE